METSSIALAEGRSILQYQVSRVLGVGGFGITYLAVDTKLQMEVAVKEYFPAEQVYRQDDGTVSEKLNIDPEEFHKGRSTFIQEAQRIARFRNHGIVRVFNFFEANGTAYMVMEYEHGESLSGLLRRRGRLPEAELDGIAGGIADALTAIHKEGYIHRDLKPDNVIIRGDGSPVLLDFGSTRDFTSQATAHMTALVTPGFAPLEQYFEERSRQGPWTDIYSMAAILYLAVTGKMPAQAPSRSAALLNDRPDPMAPAAELGAGAYRPGFLRAVDWGLALREGDRPQTLSDFREALLGGGAPPVAAPPAMAAPVPTMGAPTQAAPSTVTAGSVLATMRFRAGLTQAAPATQAVAAPVEAAPPTQAVAPPPAAPDHDPSELAGLPLDRLTAHAEEGSANAAFMLARKLMMEGPDHAERAHQWLVAAGEKGHVDAQGQLARNYATGMCCAKDEGEAARWYEAAAGNGVVAAQFEIGVRYLAGRGVAKDAASGARWLTRAAEAGLDQAQVELGLKYALGEGVAKDANQAVGWFRRAAEAGSAKGQYYLGFAHLKGLGLPRDVNQAKAWLEKAARGGSSHAMRQLGEMYEKSMGVVYDPQEACKWYYLAQMEGDEKAAKQMDILSRKIPVTRVTAAQRKAKEWLSEI